MSYRHMSLLEAVLLNINIIIGAGVFINMGVLVEAAGPYGYLAYIVAAILLIPIVVVLAHLAQQQPAEGGLYVYSRTYLTPFMGFLSGWSYFLGKATSVGLLTHLCGTHLHLIIPFLRDMPVIAIDAVILGLLVLCNIVAGSMRQWILWFFISAKSLPFIFVLSAFWLMGDKTLGAFAIAPAHALLCSVPLSLFALVGFEATCAIAHTIKDPRKNIMPAMLGGFGLVVMMVAFVQLAVGMLVQRHEAGGFVLEVIADKLCGVSTLWGPILYAAVYLSIIGGAFGMILSNSWNIHALAEYGHVPGQRWLTYTTQRGIPLVSILFHALLSFLIIVIGAHQTALQNMAAAGMVISFIIAILASIMARDGYKKPLFDRRLGAWALLSASFMLLIIIRNLYYSGISLPFLALFSIGAVVAAAYKGVQDSLY